MNLIEKLAYISFWINTIFVLFLFVGMPILFINVPHSLDLLTAKGINPFKITFSIAQIAVVFFWIYCIWFLFKYDKYSKSILPLFFLNVIYAPVYYYRVKIKKRPLRNKINWTEGHQQEDHSITETEFKKLTRENIIEILKLWASKEEIIEYQNSNPTAQVSSDLFEQWNDFYTPDSEIMNESFTQQELDLLEKFDSQLMETAKKFNGEIPQIKDFIETTDWYKLNSLAKKTLKDMK